MLVAESGILHLDSKQLESSRCLDETAVAVIHGIIESDCTLVVPHGGQEGEVIATSFSQHPRYDRLDMDVQYFGPRDFSGARFSNVYRWQHLGHGKKGAELFGMSSDGVASEWATFEGDMMTQRIVSLRLRDAYGAPSGLRQIRSYSLIDGQSDPDNAIYVEAFYTNRDHSNDPLDEEDCLELNGYRQFSSYRQRMLYMGEPEKGYRNAQQPIIKTGSRGYDSHARSFEHSRAGYVVVSDGTYSAEVPEMMSWAQVRRAVTDGLTMS